MFHVPHFGWAVLASRCILLPQMAKGLLARLSAGFALRGVLRELGLVRIQLSRQTDALERLANQFAPLAVPPKPETLREVSDTGVSFLDVIEAGIVEDYIERTQFSTGHTPDPDEILGYLADEKTVALQDRLKAREIEILLQRSERARALSELVDSGRLAP